MSVVVITSPAALVTASDAKVWAPVLAGDPDARVTALLLAAQASIERGWPGRAFGAQVLELRLDAFQACGLLRLPFPPVRAVDSVKYLDAAGAEQTFAASNYQVLGLGTADARIALVAGAGWPILASLGEAVRVRYQAGYADADPELLPAKHAVVLAATHLRSLSTQDLALRSDTTEGVGSTTWTVSQEAEKLVRTTVENLLMPYRVWSL